MLTLKIIEMHGRNCSMARLIGSFGDIISDYKVFPGYKEIVENPFDMKTDWFGIFYSDEYISSSLKDGIELLLQMETVPFDVLTFYKKEKKENRVSYAPRLFRAGTELHPDFLHAKDLNVKMEKLLDGYIYGA